MMFSVRGRGRVVVEIFEQREAVLPVRRLVELDGEDLTVKPST